MKKTHIFYVALLVALVFQSVIPMPVARASTYADWAGFIADVTVPDGSVFAPGATFTKTWRLQNIGSTTWTTAYKAVFVSGDTLGTTVSVNLPGSVVPGGTVDISVVMSAPSIDGSYRGYWQLKNASGVQFGIGSTANQSYWVDIVVGAPVTTLAYDFATNACSAIWSSGYGVLPCPGVDRDARGYVVKSAAPTYEGGYIESGPGLIVGPQNVFNGYIQGIYPAFTVQSGDKFQTAVSCAADATSCYVNFRLQYQIGSGTVQTLWSFREKFEGQFYRASVDLSSLAGKSVAFILVMDSYGFSTGDRAIWGMPRIVRGSGTVITPVPVTPTPTSTASGPTSTPTATSVSTYSACDRAQFVSDVTIPDGTIITGGSTFTKTWRLKNIGTCTWTTAYTLVYSSGTSMGNTSASFPVIVSPGQTTDLSVSLTAPATSGTYRGYWMLKNNLGQLFGIGSSGTSPFWVEIYVPATSGGGTYNYDFFANVCSATWSSAAGILPCSGVIGNATGYVSPQTAPLFENGVVQSLPGLMVGPQQVFYGYIQGIYPAYLVQPGDKFESTIQCASGATNCYVTFRLDYQVDSNPVQTFWTFNEKFDNQYYTASKDLSSLAGKNVKFILFVSAAGYATGDKAVWIAPRITGGTAIPVVATSTPTATLVGATATPTATSVGATNTPTATSTATNTPTATSTATNTPTPTSTDTPTVTPTP